jgi:hypothetical protein
VNLSDPGGQSHRIRAMPMFKRRARAGSTKVNRGRGIGLTFFYLGAMIVTIGIYIAPAPWPIPYWARTVVVGAGAMLLGLFLAVVGDDHHH